MVELEISYDEVMHRIETQQGIQFIDIRDGENYDDIEDSIKIPFSIIEREYRAINKDATVILYCDQGITSRIAAEKLQKHGLKNVYSLQGGLRAWNATLIKK